jgi:dihydrofolate reductase
MPKRPSKAKSAPKRRPATAKRDSGGGKQAPSGRVHLYVGISLDGYIAGPDAGLDWLNPYGDARAGFAPFIKTIGSVVMGRVTYDDAVARGFGDFGDTPSYVVTHRPFTPPSPAVIPFAGALTDLVAQMRERHPRDIWLMGGGSVTKSFYEADLIDIWSVAFVPAVLGAGVPMFPSGSHIERHLQLVRTHVYPSGVVELRYERPAGKSKSRSK